MIKTIFAFTVFIFVFHFVNAQNDSMYSYYKARESGYFYNLDSALKNPEKVYVLQFSQKKIAKLPDEISNLKNIEILRLSNNEIEIITDKIGEMTKMERLELSYNKIESLPPSISKLVNLKLLDLSYNKIKKLPLEVYELDRLETLNLTKNPISFFEKRKIKKKFKSKEISIIFKEVKRRKSKNNTCERRKKSRKNKNSIKALY